MACHSRNRKRIRKANGSSLQFKENFWLSFIECQQCMLKQQTTPVFNSTLFQNLPASSYISLDMLGNIMPEQTEPLCNPKGLFILISIYIYSKLHCKGLECTTITTCIPLWYHHGIIIPSPYPNLHMRSMKHHSIHKRIFVRNLAKSCWVTNPKCHLESSTI